MKFTEIERKFLIDPAKINFKSNKKESITQGYLLIEGNRHIRIRIINNKQAIACYKEGSGIKRTEIEFKVPLKEAQELMKKCIVVVKKTRQKVKVGNHIWDIDYYPDHKLYVGEVELKSEKEKFHKPIWILQEVSGQPEYSNINLGRRK